MARPVDRHAATKITSAARSLFFQHGFYKVSVDDLVSELHISKGTIYKHFRSKEKLVEEVLAQFNRQRNADLAKIMDDDSADFAQKLRQITIVQAAALSQINDRFYDDLRIHYPPLWQQYQAARQFRMDNYYRVLFQEGIAQGVIRSDVNEAFLLLAYTKLMELVIRPKSLPTTLNDAYQLLTTLFLEGALTPQGRKELEARSLPTTTP